MTTDPKDKDGLTLAGTALAPVIATALVAQGTEANAAALIGVIVGQLLPTSVLYVQEHGPGRQQREARRVRQVLNELGQLLSQQPLNTAQLSHFTDQYPALVDLMELVVRRAEADTRQSKARHYARILRDCLLHPADIDARALEVAGLIEALAEVNELDLMLMQMAQKLATREDGVVAVSDLKLLNHVDPEGRYAGGYLRGRVARLVQLGLLHERQEMTYDSIEPKGPGRAYHGESLTYGLTSYGADFQQFCQDQGLRQGSCGCSQKG